MLSQMLCNGSACTVRLGFKTKFLGREQPGNTGFARGFTSMAMPGCFKLPSAGLASKQEWIW